MTLIITKRKLGGFILLLFSLCYGAMAWHLESSAGLTAGAFTPRTLPLILAISGCVLSLLLMFWPMDTESAKAEAAQLKGYCLHLHWRPAACLCSTMLVYAALFPYFGFILSTIVFLIGCMRVLGIRNVKELFLASVPVTLLFWLILNQGLGIYLAPGLFFE